MPERGGGHRGTQQHRATRRSTFSSSHRTRQRPDLNDGVSAALQGKAYVYRNAAGTPRRDFDAGSARTPDAPADTTFSGTAVAEESKAGAPRSRVTEHNDPQYICRGCARPAFDQPRDQTANSASSPLAVARLWRSREPMRHDTTVIRCRHCRLIEAVPAVRRCLRVGLALRGQEWYRWRTAPT